MHLKLTSMDESYFMMVMDQAVHLLTNTGVLIRGKQLLDTILNNADRSSGLKYEQNTGRLKLSRTIVEWAINQAPSQFTLFDRDGNEFTQIGTDAVHFVPGSSGLNILDYDTDHVRPATTNDFIDYIRLADTLEYIAYPATAFSTNDISPALADAWRLYLTLLHTKRPVVSGAFTEHGVPLMADLMGLFRRDQAALQKQPMTIFTITPSGRLAYGEDSCQNMLDCAHYGIPVEIVPVTLMGLTAPVSLHGALVFHAADVLAGITLAQMVRPGLPVLFGGAPAVFNMQTASSPMAAIEAIKLNMLYIQFARELKLPAQTYMGLSDTKTIDAQAGGETMGSALVAALSGAHQVAGPGMLDYLLAFSLEKLVLDNEFCGQALHLIKPVRSESLETVNHLLDIVIDEGHLITARHTREEWQNHLHSPDLRIPDPIIERMNREAWQKAGSPDLVSRAHHQVERRLKSYAPPDTDQNIMREMEAMIRTKLPVGEKLPVVKPIEYLDIQKQTNLGRPRKHKRSGKSHR